MLEHDVSYFVTRQHIHPGDDLAASSWKVTERADGQRSAITIMVNKRRRPQYTRRFSIPLRHVASASKSSPSGRVAMAHSLNMATYPCLY
jgi:hypothetical protein